MVMFYNLFIFPRIQRLFFIWQHLSSSKLKLGKLFIDTKLKMPVYGYFILEWKPFLQLLRFFLVATSGLY